MRNLRTLEQEGMVNSNNDYQEVINAIAKVRDVTDSKLIVAQEEIGNKEMGNSQILVHSLSN